MKYEIKECAYVCDTSVYNAHVCVYACVGGFNCQWAKVNELTTAGTLVSNFM